MASGSGFRIQKKGIKHFLKTRQLILDYIGSTQINKNYRHSTMHPETAMGQREKEKQQFIYIFFCNWVGPPPPFLLPPCPSLNIVSIWADFYDKGFPFDSICRTAPPTLDLLNLFTIFLVLKNLTFFQFAIPALNWIKPSSYAKVLYFYCNYYEFLH